MPPRGRRRRTQPFKRSARPAPRPTRPLPSWLTSGRRRTGRLARTSVGVEATSSLRKSTCVLIGVAGLFVGLILRRNCYWRSVRVILLLQPISGARLCLRFLARQRLNSMYEFFSSGHSTLLRGPLRACVGAARFLHLPSPTGDRLAIPLTGSANSAVQGPHNALLAHSTT